MFSSAARNFSSGIRPHVLTTEVDKISHWAKHQSLSLQIQLNVIHVTSGYDTPSGDLVENLLPFGSLLLQGISKKHIFLFLATHWCSRPLLSSFKFEIEYIGRRDGETALYWARVFSLQAVFIRENLDRRLPSFPRVHNLFDSRTILSWSSRLYTYKDWHPRYPSWPSWENSRGYFIQTNVWVPYQKVKSHHVCSTSINIVVDRAKLYESKKSSDIP